MGSGDYYWGLYRDYYRDPFPHSLLSTRLSYGWRVHPAFSLQHWSYGIVRLSVSRSKTGKYLRHYVLVFLLLGKPDHDPRLAGGSIVKVLIYRDLNN